MTNTPNEEEFNYGDYDLEETVTPLSADLALDYVEVATQDDEAVHGLDMPGDAPRTSREALAVAHDWSKRRLYFGVGMCLKTVRQYYGVASKYGTAEECWNATDHKVHVSDGRDIPRGVPVYWTNGRAGHIAISLGGGLCYSTDWREPGKIDVAVINEIGPRWGQHLAGYAWEVNDVIVWRPDVPKAAVSLKNLKRGETHEDVLQVKKALRKKGYKGFVLNKKFGIGLLRAYKKYQERLGYNGHAANGTPGTLSLKKLGFKVLP